MGTQIGVTKNMWSRTQSGLYAPSRMNFSTNGLVFYAPLWHPNLNGATFNAWDVANDTVHACTVTGATWGTQGRDFDGVDDIITIPDAASIQNIFDGGGTVIAWVYAATAGENNQGAIARKTWNFDVFNYADPIMGLRFGHTFDGDDGVWSTAARDITKNTWYCVAVMYDSGAAANNPTLYVNLTPKTVGSGLTESGTPTGTSDSDSGTDLTIGNIGAGTLTWDGIIGEEIYYNRILSVGEYSRIYQATKWRYT